LAVGGLGMPPETKYAHGRHGAVGYQVFGSGPIDLVMVANWATNVDTFWDEPSVSCTVFRSVGFLFEGDLARQARNGRI